MPRYFFNVHDGSDLPDPEGTELADLDAARKYAVRYAACLLLDSSETFWGGTDWSMDVTDDQGLFLFTLHFVATEAPSIMTH